MKLTAAHVRSELEKEEIHRESLAYLSNSIEGWWKNRNMSLSLHLLKLQVVSLLMQHVKPEHAKYFNLLGKKHVAGVCLTDVFSSDDHMLALLVHEALCELFHLNDIKYSYEDHKALFLKPGGENYRDWGNGYGIITPHSDDLYEDTPTDFLALTVCRDETATPTSSYFPKDIIAALSDAELEILITEKATFKSGKNVNALKYRERPFVECVRGEIHVHLDFRIDTVIGERMLPKTENGLAVVKKMRSAIECCHPVYAVPRTGTFFIVANYKVMHSRAEMQIDREIAAKLASAATFSNTPRLLYRSKGPCYDISLKNGYAQYL